jgi:hypothetical protein
MNQMRLYNHLTISLCFLCGALILISLAEITFLDPADSATYSDTSNTNIDPPKITNLEFIPISPGNFTHILQRPLLFEARRMPAAPAVAAQPKKPQTPLRLKLEGIAISSDRRIALLRNTADNQLLQLVEGMSHDGWTLEELNSTSGKFIRGSAVTEIMLETSVNGRRRGR